MDSHERNRRDNHLMLLVTAGCAIMIVIVLYFADAFMKSTG